MERETIDQKIAFLEWEYKNTSDIVSKLKQKLANAEDDLVDIIEELDDLKALQSKEL
jgi:exonuclease VII small subunit